MSEPTVTIPLSDYKRLVQALDCDEMIMRCEVCGAWLDLNDSATASVDDFRGCWKAATHDPRYDKDCKSYRATITE